MGRIGEGAMTLARENLALAAEAVRLHRLFAEARIPHLFLKGVALAVLAYGNLAVRHGKDIDLLVEPDTAVAAARILEGAGYRRHQPPARLSETQLRRLRPVRKDSAHLHEDGTREVELHWRLFDNPHVMAGISSGAASRVVAMSPGIGLPTLAEEDLFAYVCAHGASHCWYRLKWLADVGGLLTSASDADLERLYRAAAARGVGPAAAHALLLCRRLLGTPISDDLLARLRADVRARWLERIGLWAMRAGNEEQALPDLPFGGTRIMLAHYLLDRGWRYWLSELRIQLTRAEDMLMLPLPERLSFLYLALRVPLWMCRRAMGHPH